MEINAISNGGRQFIEDIIKPNRLVGFLATLGTIKVNKLSALEEIEYQFYCSTVGIK
jgi:hypothetical protein